MDKNSLARLLEICNLAYETTSWGIPGWIPEYPARTVTGAALIASWLPTLILNGNSNPTTLQTSAPAERLKRPSRIRYVPESLGRKRKQFKIVFPFLFIFFFCHFHRKHTKHPTIPCHGTELYLMRLFLSCRMRINHHSSCKSNSRMWFSQNGKSS